LAAPRNLASAPGRPRVGYKGPVLRRSGLALLGLAAVAPAARAEDGESAASLFDQGLAAMQVGRYKIGCALIKQSLDVEARPGTVFTLAECYAKAGRYASAIELYDRYLSAVAALPPEQQAAQRDRVEVSQVERTQILSLVAWLTVRLEGTPPGGLRLSRDGAAFPVELAGLALAFDPGPHVFTTQAGDGDVTEYRIVLVPGERTELVLRSIGAPAADSTGSGSPPGAAAADAAPESGPSAGPWPWVAAGVGTAGLVTAGVSGFLLVSARAKFLDDCDTRERTCTTRAGLDAQESARDLYAPLTGVGLAVGAAGLGTAALLWWLAPDGAGPTAATRAVPLAVTLPSGGWVGVSQNF